MIVLLIDRSVLFPRARWLLLLAFLAFTLYRLLANRYLLVLLVLGFYAIFFLLKFFTPSGISHNSDASTGGINLNDRVDIEGTRQNDRPLIRCLNEFSLWKQLTVVGLVGLASTTFEFLAVEVNPLYLAIYFLWLGWLAWEKHQNQCQVYNFGVWDFIGKSKERNDGLDSCS